MAKHWIWSAYLALSEHQLTAAQAVAKLEADYPGQPVRTVLEAMGDTSLISKTITAQQVQPAQGSAGAPSGTQGAANGAQAIAGAQPPAGPKRMTPEDAERLRARIVELSKQEGAAPASQAAQPAPDDFNAQLRARADRHGRKVTMVATHEAMMGQPERPADAGGGDDFNETIRRRAFGG